MSHPNSRRPSPLLLLIALVALLVLSAQSALADSPSVFQRSSSTKSLGGALGGSFTTGVRPSTTSSTQAALSTALVDILGLGLQALSALANPPNTIDGVTYTEVYAFGKRVFSQDVGVTYGLNSVTVGLAPIEIRVPVVVYPVGPVPLEVDGGARFHGDLKLQANPTIFIPVSKSSLGVVLQTDVDASGFIEGYANFLVVRAGAGGQVDLVDASANVNAEFWFDGSPPQATVSASVDFLSGKFYAFLDYFSLFSFGWKRLLNYTLFSWNGYCFSTGGVQCP